MGHHHELSLIGVMELRPNQLRHHREVSPRGSWNYALTTYQSSLTIQYVLAMHMNLMPTFKTNLQSFSIPKPCQNSSSLAHESFHTYIILKSC